MESGKVVASKHALQYALELCRDGCLLGLGTGTTVRTFIELAKDTPLLRRSFIVVTSLDTAIVLESLNIESYDTGLPRERIDLYIDSADEVDRRRFMIKGGGAALLREKVVANLSRYRLYIVDETKVSNLVGEKKPLPVEVVVFAYPLVAKRLRELGYSYTLRYGTGKYGPVLSDNGCLILDVNTGPMRAPEEIDKVLTSLPGVTCTGLFTPTLVDKIVVGYSSGRVEEL